VRFVNCSFWITNGPKPCVGFVKYSFWIVNCPKPYVGLSNTPFGLWMAQTFCIFQTRLLLDTFPIGH
jgi:hypothetical protein